MRLDIFTCELLTSYGGPKVQFATANKKKQNRESQDTTAKAESATN